MLCKKIPDSIDVEIFITNTYWAVQQKMDGIRLLIEVKDREPIGYNRNGNRVKIPDNIAANFDQAAFTSKWVFDGELVGDTYYIFDCLQAGEGLNFKTPQLERFSFLKSLMLKWKPKNIELVPYALNENSKREFFRKALEENKEGVIFKYVKGPYKPGSRSKDTLKFKFIETADVVVTELNRENKKQSIGIGLYNSEGNLVEVSGCKIPEEAIDNISVGDVIEVKYLYATKDDRLYQPVWVKIRTDKSAVECTTKQLKYTDKSPNEIVDNREPV